jgi:hypothetical protein
LKKINIAILDFKNAGKAPGCGKMVSQSLADKASRKLKSWHIVDRKKMNALIKEKKYTLSSGDFKNIFEFSRDLNVDLLVSGTVTKCHIPKSALDNPHLAFEFQFVWVHTSELVAAGNYTRKSRMDFDELLIDGTEEVLDVIHQKIESFRKDPIL